MSRANSLSNFKYYIHDSVAEYRLQLLGDLTSSQVTELCGCWQTARTTLGNRRLKLDVRGLKSADIEGQNWLEQMAKDGAVFLPEIYPQRSANPPGKTSQESVAAIKLSRLGRVLGIFNKTTPTESSEAALRTGDAR
jgi:hypothetical protein